MRTKHHRDRRRLDAARSVACASALACLAAALSAAVPARAGAAPRLTCSTRTLNVAIDDPGPADQTMWGQLCYRGPVEPKTVQLVVPGATYNHIYWDFPYGHGYYSYVDAATAAGYATFNVDRIGTGSSSHPPSADVTVTANAVALHDAITDLRAGTVDGHRFQHVIWVSHSLGSLVGWYEISRYHDVDAAILTGALHAVSPDLGAAIGGDVYPAADDPAFADSGLDPGYLTTVPGSRESLFYYPATANPAVVALDEATKDTGTVAELGIFSAITLPPDQAPSQQITVPVLLVDGQQDAIFCQEVTQYNCAGPASVLSYESQYYPPQAHLQVAIIPGTGHDLALSTTAPLADAIMIGWALSAVTP